MEHLFLEVHMNKIKFLLGVVYAAPKCDYFNTLEQLFDTFLPQYNSYTLMGDFNTCLLRNDARSKRMINISTSYNISILDLDATFHINDSHSKLDLILTGDSERISAYGQFPAPGFSHHDLIYASIKIKSPKIKPKVVMQRNFAAIDNDALRSDFGATDWSYMLSLNNIDEKISIFNSALTSLYDRHAPYKPVRMKRPPAPWLTDDIRKLMARRNHLYRKYRKTPNDATFSNFKRARNRCNQMIRNAKRRNIYSEIENCTPNNVWKVLRGLGFGKMKSVADSSFDVNVLNRHFSAVPFKIDDLTKDITIAQLSQQPLGNYTSFSFESVGACEIVKIIMATSTKAVGHDGIGRKLLLPILDLIAPHIAHIVNFSLSNNTFPSEWKKAFVIPIPKKTVTSELKDFRPISILPFLSKILEKVVHRQLSTFLRNNNLLSPFQSGFRSSHSTSTALIKITDDIRSAIDDKKLTLLTLLDFSNAFNCVDHDILLAVLRSLNFSHSNLLWFSSYLDGRQQCVRIDDIYSGWCNVDSGVPQGGVLSPLLFSIFINTIVPALRFSSFHLYADDVQLYVSFEPDQTAHGIDCLNRDLVAIYNWTQKFGLQINPSKTQVMIIGGNYYISRLNTNCLPLVIYNSQPLQFCTEVKNLGLYITNNLSWDCHIAQVGKKMYGSMHSLKLMKNFLPQSTRLTLVNALLFPILDYADVCYPDATEEQLNKLERLQNLCIRFVYGLRKYDHVSDFRDQLKWLKIRERRDVHTLCLLFNILNNPLSPNYLKERFTPLFDGRRPVRSVSNRMLTTPLHNTSGFSDSFTVTAVRLWNSIPHTFREVSSVEVFKSKLTSYYLSHKFK